MKTIQQAYSINQVSAEKKESLVHKFFMWCESQESSRFGWLGVILGSHACFITPFTAMFIIFAGNSPLLWAFAIGAIAMSLVVNLAGLSTKITIPVFFLSLLIDLAVIVNCIAVGLSIPGTV